MDMWVSAYDVSIENAWNMECVCGVVGVREYDIMVV